MEYPREDMYNYLEELYTAKGQEAKATEIIKAERTTISQQIMMRAIISVHPLPCEESLKSASHNASTQIAT